MEDMGSVLEVDMDQTYGPIGWVREQLDRGSELRVT